MMVAASFPSYFLEQGFHWTLLFLAALAIVVLGVLAGALFLVRRRLGLHVVSVLLLAAAIALLVAVVAITLYEAAALWYRSLPHGSGNERPAGGFEDFYSAAKVAFFGLYALLIGFAVAAAWVLGRMRTRSGGLVAGTAGLVTGAYLVVTLPFVEFQNACDVGRSFVIAGIDC